MNKYISPLILILSLHVLPGLSQPAKNNIKTVFKLQIQFQPDSGYINGFAEIEYPADSCFTLAKNLNIISIRSGLEKILYKVRISQSNPFSNEIQLNKYYKNLIIEYSGRIKPEELPETMSNRNMISKSLVELNDHIDWYPRIKASSPIKYNVLINLPSNFIAITNGVQKIQITKLNTIITEWEIMNAYQIILIAIPGLQKADIEENGNKLEIYYSKLSKSYVDSMKSDLLRSFELLTDMFGPNKSNQLVRMIYSPRGAGAYARVPLFIVSENYALEQQKNKYGYYRDFFLNTHEISHYWSLANPNTPDDWINEGLAEFSAYWISEIICGKVFADFLMSEYNGIVNNSETHIAIAKTESDSWEREINRYYKPTILLNQIRLKYGEENLKLFLRSLYSRFVESKMATTEIFLDEMEKRIGKEASVFFSEALYKEKWNADKAETDFLFVPSDSILIGTWSGLLSQFGTTNQFVLNLKLTDGKLIPTLGNQGENANRIPVTALQIKNNNISFAVAIASAVFKGNLDRKNRIIEGVWIQRGTEYPLILSLRSEE